VTHDAEVAAAADRIVQMRDGKVEGDQVPASVGAQAEPAYGVLENPTQ
jgi:ABC-type lipoprotein export system ATPase subunit